MAKLDFFIPMLALLLVVSTVMAEDEFELAPTELSDEGFDISPSPYVYEDFDDGFTVEAPPPETESERYVELCVRAIGDVCGNELFYAIFEDKSVISAACCDKLLQVDQGCSDALITSVLQIPELKGYDPKKIYENNAKVYYQCLNSGVEAPAPSISSA